MNIFEKSAAISINFLMTPNPGIPPDPRSTPDPGRTARNPGSSVQDCD